MASVVLWIALDLQPENKKLKWLHEQPFFLGHCMEKLYQHFQIHKKISTDSRLIEKDCIFFALKGENFDGNQYAAAALEKGAAFAVIDNPDFQSIQGTYLVNDVLSFLQEFARHHRTQLHIPILGITGTNGKTTTKELIRSVLATQFRVYATIGNLNNHLGVPLTILSLPEDAQVGIIEMGANHVGEIDFLCRIAQPTHGIITNVGKAHLEGFGSFEGVIQTKTELYRYLQSFNRMVFVNADNPYLAPLAGDAAQTYSIEKQKTELIGRVISADPTLVFRVIDQQGNSAIASTHLAGAYNLENALAAIRIGLHFGVSLANCIEGIESYRPENKRSQWISTRHNQVLMDAYNANPTSMDAALRNFSALDAPDKLLILGGMRELGRDSDSEHLGLLDLASQLGFKNIFLVGTEFKYLKIQSTWLVFDSTDELLEYLKLNPLQNYHILVKGSRGNQLEKTLSFL